MDNRLWQDANLVHGDDSTKELIRKHSLYKAEMKKISDGAIKRGEDYHGGYDDSIANDLTEIEATLYERAIMHHDRDAMFYIMDNPVDGSFWISGQLSIAKAVYNALKEEIEYPTLEVIKALELLKSICPDEYPTSPDTNDSEDEEDE